jgi:CO/xanthine dehydrogenase Mo-binding subunit
MLNALNRLGRVRWNVYLKERYPHGRGVVTYLGRYLRGGPIANARLRAADTDTVTFGYTDHRDGKRKAMTLSAADFLGRVLEHVPPPGTHGVRAYGLYATSKRAVLDRARHALGQPPAEPPPVLTWQDVWIGDGETDPTRCSVCGRPLVVTVPVPRHRAPPMEVRYACAA